MVIKKFFSLSEEEKLTEEGTEYAVFYESYKGNTKKDNVSLLSSSSEKKVEKDIFVFFDLFILIYYISKENRYYENQIIQ